MTRTVLKNLSTKKRFDSEEDKQALLDLVLKYTKEGKKRKEIASLINRSETAVTTIYWAELFKQGKLEKGENGRPKVSAAEKSQTLYDELSKSDFVTQNPEIQIWIDKMKVGGKKGTGVVNWGDKITAMYIVCKNLQVRPNAFLISSSETSKLMDKFKAMFQNGEISYAENNGKGNFMSMRSGKDTSIYRYTSAVANFCMRNDKPLPKGMDGSMSRKKENYAAYGTVQISDNLIWGKDGMIDFLMNHPEGGAQWATLAATHHELISRTNTHLKTKYVFVEKTAMLDGVQCQYIECPQVYESKTHKSFDKLIIHPKAIELVRKYAKSGELILQEKTSSGRLLSGKSVSEKYNNLLRQFYVKVGLIAPEALDNYKLYKKVIDGQKYYLNDSPNYALRHSGCHAWARRCQYNVTMIMTLGWDDPNMVIHVYGKMSNEFRLKGSACRYCRPELCHESDENDFFCSWAHALIYFNNGGKAKEGTSALNNSKPQDANLMQVAPQTPGGLGQ